MKKLIITVALVLMAAASAQADQYIKINKGIKGVLLGAGGGALAGQAIGRDTESTLIGTAVGTLVGYMVGNEMDKNSVQPGQVSYRPNYNSVPVYREQMSTYRYNNYAPAQDYHARSGNCKDVEILGTVHGNPEKIITTACETPQGWILVDSPAESAAGYNYRPQTHYRQSSVNSGYRPNYNNYHQRVRYQY